MIADLEQIADEVILARHLAIRAGQPADDLDTEYARRMDQASVWRHLYPALDKLADDRLTELAHLEAKGVTPEPSCAAAGPGAPLVAEQDTEPLQHRYTVRRMGEREQIGTVWLSTQPDRRGLYVAVSPLVPGHVLGPRLGEALLSLARYIADGDRLRHDVRKGLVQ